MNRTKISVTLLLILAIGVVLYADSPHFIGKASAQLVGADLFVSFKEAGLGDNALITYVASADATASFVCVNGGGQCPNAANKATVSGPDSATGTFASGKNGQVTQSLTVEALGPGGFFCPNGQNLVLASVSYSNITVTDITNNVTVAAVPSTLSATFFTCPSPN
jgi:hypothetical protein